MTPDARKLRRQPLRRRIYFREPVQRFLIVCEGKKTEKIYFDAFKVPKDVRSIKVIGAGRSTVSLVREAIQLKEKDDYDQVWCVFDVEDYPAEDVRAAYRLARKHHIEIACSNQKFELWYLLHFHYYCNAIDRAEYDRTLSELLREPYEKDTKLYARLAPLQEQAMRNAQRLVQEYQPFDPAVSNPSTTVHLLVEQLNRFMPDSRA